jgi:hypothetical protein
MNSISVASALLNSSERDVFCEDAIQWLKTHGAQKNISIVSSLPDWSEFPRLSLDDWKKWFTESASLILSNCDEAGFTFFYQSDIKVDGTWVDKSFLCQKAAEETGHALLFRKMVCRAPAGTLTFGRPSFSHLLCFSKRFRIRELSQSTSDILIHPGAPTWKRGMGLQTCLEIAKFIKKHQPTHLLVNPFCGEGAMLAAANHVGLRAAGVEKSAKRAEAARLLQISKDSSRWLTNKALAGPSV